MNDYESARSHLEKALKFNREEGAKKSLAVTLQLLGNLCLRRNDIPAEEKYLEQARTLALTMNLRTSLWAILYRQGLCREKKGDLKAAEWAYRDSIVMSKNCGSFPPDRKKRRLRPLLKNQRFTTPS